MIIRYIMAVIFLDPPRAASTSVRLMDGCGIDSGGGKRLADSDNGLYIYDDRFRRNWRVRICDKSTMISRIQWLAQRSEIIYEMHVQSAGYSPRSMKEFSLPFEMIT